MPHLLALWYWTSSSQNCEQYASVVYKLLSPRYLVVEAYVAQDNVLLRMGIHALQTCRQRWHGGGKMDGERTGHEHVKLRCHFGTCGGGLPAVEGRGYEDQGEFPRYGGTERGEAAA